METEIQRCLFCCLPFRAVGFSLEGTGTTDGREAVPLPSKQVSLLRPLCSACAPLGIPTRRGKASILTHSFPTFSSSELSTGCCLIMLESWALEGVWGKFKGAQHHSRSPGPHKQLSSHLRSHLVQTVGWTCDPAFSGMAAVL